MTESWKDFFMRPDKFFKGIAHKFKKFPKAYHISDINKSPPRKCSIFYRFVLQDAINQKLIIKLHSKYLSKH